MGNHTSPSPSSRRSTLWLGVLFAMLFPTLIAWGYFLAGAEGGAEPSKWVQQVYLAGKIIQFAFPIVFLLLLRERWPRLVLPSRQGLLLGLGFGVLVGALILGAYFLFLRDTPGMQETARRVHAKLVQGGITTAARYLLLASVLCVPHSLGEEYYWRWFVFGRLRQWLPFVPAMVLSSLAFMAHHVIILYVYLPGQFFTQVVPFSLCIAIGGAAWAWLYNRVGTLYPSWLSHLLVDAAIFAVGWDIVVRSLSA
jgi:membrane protease YdiL (CAAX protease family)